MAGMYFQDNTIMEATVDTYTQELIDWFDRKSYMEENALSKTTQELWYSHYLEKKRLEKRGISTHHVQYEHVPYNVGAEPETVCFYGVDGKYQTCDVGRMTMLDIRYFREGLLLGQEKAKRDIAYYIVSAKNAQGQYICPNCGAEQSLEMLLDGCDHCNTKFDISAYEDKIASVNRNKNRFGDRETNGAVFVWIILGVIALMLAGVCFVMGIGSLFHCFTAFFISPLYAVLGLLFGAFCFVGGFACLIPVIGVVWAATKSNSKAIHNTMMKAELSKANPDFSFEAFVSGLDCKIKSIHYAEDASEVAVFVKCDIAPFVEENKTVISCEPGKIAMSNYRQEGDFQYIDVNREIRVMKDCGNHVEWAGGTIALTLAKKKEYKLKNEINLYTCPHCGASVSLVEGGKCKYCDSEMDYAAYDWIVTKYEIVKEENKK